MLYIIEQLKIIKDESLYSGKDLRFLVQIISAVNTHSILVIYQYLRKSSEYIPLSNKIFVQAMQTLSIFDILSPIVIKTK